MHSEKIVISLRNVTKTYRIFRHAGDRLKQAMLLGRWRFHEEFTALQDVSFQVERGETIGIIGSNGAGKSTLLQLICGILKPTAGTVEVEGRISAMLELGAGFNPEFTGRENVYFQGTLMGLSEAQMNARFADIEDFADIGAFIDQPVRTYSSGMFVRLAFAVATHVEPDILIIDEVLAVGDANFQQKCLDLIAKLQSGGTSILVVSHNPYHIERLCDKAAVLRHGRISDLRPAKEILSRYHEIVQQDITCPAADPKEDREGTQEVVFERVYLESPTESGDNTVLSTEEVRIVADVAAKQPIVGVHFRFELYSSKNELVTVISTLGHTEETCFEGRHRISFSMRPCQLTSGWHYVTAIAGHQYARLDTWQRAVDFKVLLRNKDAQLLSMDQGVFIPQGHWAFERCSRKSACANY